MSRPRVTVVDDPDTVVDNLGGFRRRLLELLDEPDSATGLARRLGTSRQKVNYHLRTLEEAGFVELAEVRQRRGLSERLVRRVADVVVVDPLAFDTSGLARQDVVGVSGVVATATDLIRHAAEVTSAASDRGARLAASAVDTEIRLETPAALRSLLEDLAALLARYDSETGLVVRVANLVLPAKEE